MKCPQEIDDCLVDHSTQLPQPRLDSNPSLLERLEKIEDSYRNWEERYNNLSKTVEEALKILEELRNK